MDTKSYLLLLPVLVIVELVLSFSNLLCAKCPQLRLLLILYRHDESAETEPKVNQSHKTKLKEAKNLQVYLGVAM